MIGTVSALRPPAPTPAALAERAEDLMARVARGDQQAFERLYAEFAAPVYGLVRRVLRDPAQSEEVTQEVLVTLWQSASRYDPSRGTVRAWVMTMAHRRAVDRVRSEQSATERIRLVGQREIRAPYDDVVETVDARLESESVRRGLRSLTQIQREAITLAYYGGHSYPEVATMLGVPLGTVKTRIRDGLIRLRDALGAGA